jgi:hypothetical protein
MFTLDETAARELDARLDAYRAEAVAAELRTAADDLGLRIRAGGPRARGLVYARSLLLARANGTDPETPRTQANHAEAAEKLRAEPGVWLPVADYADKGSATAIARHIRYAILPAYAPAGAFDARPEPTLDGYRVVACFIDNSRKDVRP